MRIQMGGIIGESADSNERHHITQVICAGAVSTAFLRYACMPCCSCRVPVWRLARCRILGEALHHILDLRHQIAALFTQYCRGASKCQIKSVAKTRHATSFRSFLHVRHARKGFSFHIIILVRDFHTLHGV